MIVSTGFLFLFCKVEVSMSVLWESLNDDPRGIHARYKVLTTLKDINQQVTLWRIAGEAN